MENSPTTPGKIFLFLGLIFMATTALWIISNRFPRFGIGRLPGDIVVKKENFSFYFPVVTCILGSVLLSLTCWLVSFFMRR